MGNKHANVCAIHMSKNVYVSGKDMNGLWITIRDYLIGNADPNIFAQKHAIVGNHIKTEIKKFLLLNYQILI